MGSGAVPLGVVGLLDLEHPSEGSDTARTERRYIPEDFSLQQHLCAHSLSVTSHLSNPSSSSSLSSSPYTTAVLVQ